MSYMRDKNGRRLDSIAVLSDVEQRAASVAAVAAADPYEPKLVSGKRAVRKDELLFNARDYGAVGDGATNNTTVLQGLIDQAIAAGGGRIWIPAGVYRFDRLVISAPGNLGLTIEGERGTVLYAAPTLTTDAFVIDSGSTVPGSNFTRRITLRNIALQGNTNYNSGTMAPRRGLILGRVQDLTLEHVWISQFRLGGLILDDCFDSTFHDVQVMWCGVGASDTDYAYAVQLTGTIDNSNANHFSSCHFELNQLMLSISHLSRNNYFTNCKFEHGSQTAQNASSKSAIYLADCLENGFTDCLFTEDVTSTTGNPFVTSDNYSVGQANGASLRKHITFKGCCFLGTTTAKARWFTGYDTNFDKCVFQNSDGSVGGFVFDLAARNKIRDCTITFVDAGAQFLRITDTANLVDGNTIFTTASGTAGAVYTIGSAARQNLITDNNIVGAFTSSVASTLSASLLSNVVTNRFAPTRTASGGGTPSVFTYDIVTLTDTTAATYTNFTYGYSGQRIAVTATNGGVVTLQNNAIIVLTGGANLTLAAGQIITLVNVGGVWKGPA